MNVFFFQQRFSCIFQKSHQLSASFDYERKRALEIKNTISLTRQKTVC